VKYLFWTSKIIETNIRSLLWQLNNKKYFNCWIRESREFQKCDSSYYQKIFILRVIQFQFQELVKDLCIGLKWLTMQ